MEHKGFPTRSLNWMRSIFAFGTSSIVLNGVPSKIFHYKRRALLSLQYANDTLIFMKESIAELTHLKDILVTFAEALWTQGQL
jgi:hypothetical protein